MTDMLDVLTCLAVACVLFPLDLWGRYQAENRAVDPVEGEERGQRIAVLRGGADLPSPGGGVHRPSRSGS